MIKYSLLSTAVLSAFSFQAFAHGPRNIAAGNLLLDASNAAQIASPAAITALTAGNQFSFTPVVSLSNSCNLTITDACLTLRNATTAASAVQVLQEGAGVIEAIAEINISFNKKSPKLPVINSTLINNLATTPLVCPFTGVGLSAPGVGYVITPTITISQISKNGFRYGVNILIFGSSLTAAAGLLAALVSLPIAFSITAESCCNS